MRVHKVEHQRDTCSTLAWIARLGNRKGEEKRSKAAVIDGSVSNMALHKPVRQKCIQTEHYEIQAQDPDKNLYHSLPENVFSHSIKIVKTDRWKEFHVGTLLFFINSKTKRCLSESRHYTSYNQCVALKTCCELSFRNTHKWAHSKWLNPTPLLRKWKSVQINFCGVKPELIKLIRFPYCRSSAYIMYKYESNLTSENEGKTCSISELHFSNNYLLLLSVLHQTIYKTLTLLLCEKPFTTVLSQESFYLCWRTGNMT